MDDETSGRRSPIRMRRPDRTLDITGLNERICTMVNMLESGVVDLTPVPVQPSVTRAQLEAQIVKLSSFETTVGKTGDYVESRTENIRVGTERFNRLTVAPGKSVSFNKVALKRSTANGYQVALEIAYGNYVEGIGGGICQVSSTLYNAVVNAGLTVNKRTPHAIPSSYVDKGKDATVSDDRYDFVFTNNTGANIYIETQFV
ncbi:MAG: VanW family protein, partial [Christensenellales bacterium]